MIPGTAAVLSLLVSRSYYEHWKIPLFEPDDAERASNIVALAIEKIAGDYEAALENLERDYVDLERLSQALLGSQTGTT
jgi:hypothetical protein